jgi:cytochrome P450
MLTDPGALFDALKAHGGGVCPVASPAPFYAVLDEPDVRSVLRDHRQWPSRLGPGLAYAQPNGVLVASDPPSHTAQRALLAPVFRPAAMAELSASVQELVDGLVAAALARGRADLITDLAAPMSLSVVCGLLGLRTDRLEEYWSWVLKLGQGLMYPAGSMDGRVVAAYRAFYEHFNPHIVARRAALDAGEAPPADLLAQLMTARRDGRALSRFELLAFCQFLLVAGSSTTALLVGNLVHRLLEHPDQLALLRKDRSLVPNAIEESLRFDTPLRGLFRTAAEAAHLGGADIPAGAKILVMFAAANHDPGQWSDPDRFDITRDTQTLRRHYSFGHGGHYCLGAPLARLEATVLLNAILDRMPGLRLDGAPTRVEADILDGYAHLPITWDR